jgi:hypothetical protein
MTLKHFSGNMKELDQLFFGELRKESVGMKTSFVEDFGDEIIADPGTEFPLIEKCGPNLLPWTKTRDPFHPFFFGQRIMSDEVFR